MSSDPPVDAPAETPQASASKMADRSTSRSVAIQIWIIGALIPIAVILRRDLGEYDFAAFWVACNQVLAGETANIYDSAATQVYARRLGLAQATVFPYPPHALFLYMPFAWLPYIPSYLLWNLVSATFFWWAARPYVPKGFPPLLSVTTPAALICLDFGQTGLIFGGLWLLAFRGQWAAVAVLTFKPHLGLLSVLSVRDRAALFRTACLAVLLMAASALLFGSALWASFFEHLLGHGERITSTRRWLFAGVGPAMGYGFWGWIPFAAAGALMLARNVNVFTASTASFLISPYGFHYDMPVACLGFGLLIFKHWHAMPVRYRIPIAMGFLSPVIAHFGAWWVPPFLLWSLWIQIKYDVATPRTLTARLVVPRPRPETVTSDKRNE